MQNFRVDSYPQGRKSATFISVSRVLGTCARGVIIVITGFELERIFDLKETYGRV